MTNTALQDTLERIEAGPSGPRIGAFFDLDGTIVAGFTGGAYYADRLRKGDVGPLEGARTAVMVADGLLGGDHTRIGETGVQQLRGMAPEDLAELGERLFAKRTARTIRPQARQLVAAHQRKGHTVAVASSATHFQIDSIARDLGVEHILCTELEEQDGLLTGAVKGGMLWGEAKARAVRGMIRSLKLTRSATYGYANGAEDVAFLSSVGRPHAVTPHATLRRVAERQGWPVVELEDPRSGGPRAVVSSFAAMGAMNIGMAAGLGIGLLRRDSQMGRDMALSFGFKSFLGAAGVRLNVVGSHRLWAHRPAVFVFNHQSGLDAIIVCALLQENFSGIGKKSAKNNPLTALSTYALDLVYVDRGTSKAREQGKGLVDRLNAGKSVFVAPEGTRSPTPVLAPFKTGAFHAALDAGVPVVPIVVRNAYELMPGDSMGIVGGTVDVAVLEPIWPDGWKREEMRAVAASVRQRFVDTMDNWPTEG
jgi:putative phosphoserine phosphatase / 1-acylglycerol-3-phosphate O-acyltransferase